MPRIPVRIEPYTSPSRQHRHFKNKRDQVLRVLGKAAYINGSHFAIMWVSARGDVETYASEALQDRLEDWFDKSGLMEEAKKLVIGAQGNPRSNPFIEDGGEEDGDDLSDDERGLSLQVPTGSTSQSNSLVNTPVTPSHDVFGGGPRRPQLQRSASTSGSRLRGRKAGVSPLNTNLVNNEYQRLRNNNGELHPQSAMESHFMGSLTGLGLAGNTEMDLIPPHSAPLRPMTMSKAMSRSPSSNQQHVPQFETRLENQAARTAFLELRFSQLQQGMCKTVAKAWIKIIEPKKQTRCPYNKGEEGKPSWWPDGVRHKEPDHLMKPERHALLLTILRSPKIQVARLQLATAEVVALIKADRVSLLMDVYRIAREEEKMREAGMDVDSSITVGVSTLDGWSEVDQCVTAESNTSVEEEVTEPSATTKKRATAMNRSASASAALRSNKRRASAMEGSASPFNIKGGNLDIPDSIPRQSSNGWMTQEGLQKSIKRPASSQSMTSTPNGTIMAYSQSHQPIDIDQTYGLMTPMTNHTAIMESNFIHSASKQNNNDSTSALVAGYMSAPQPSHTQLFPEGSYHQFQANTTPHQQYNIHASRDASNLFAFQQQQQQQREGTNQTPDSNNHSALGLQGINMHWSQAGFHQDFSSNHQQSNNGWWQQQHQQQHSHTKEAGEASFDTSFASTADSVGPATPPLGSGHQQFTRANEGKHNQISMTAHDFMQQQQNHQQQNQSQATHQQQHHSHQQQSHFNLHTQQATSNGHSIVRSSYNLSLGKVPTTAFETWSYQA